MLRKTRILSLSIASVCTFAVSNAHAQFLPGNVWPNPSLTTAAPAGQDPIDLPSGSLYGDTNPRPDGWHRGGVDFTYSTSPTYVEPPPEMTFWTPVEGSTLNPSPSGTSLEIDDADTSNYGEWFSDYNPLPAASQGTGIPFNFQFFWEYAGITSTQRPAGTDVFRVSVRWGNASSSIYAGDLGGGPDELIFDGSPDVTSWTQVNELLTPPIGATTMEMTIDSGGSSQATGQIWVDDISAASVVPEPTSIAALTAGSMLLLNRRRRRRA